MSRKASDDHSIDDDQNVLKKMKYECRKVKGTVVLMKKNILDLNDIRASVVDRFDEICGHKVFLQLVSAVNPDPVKKVRGKLGKKAALENWITKITPLTAEYVTFGVTFEWYDDFGIPGAFIIQNHHHNEFFLKTLTLEHVPHHGTIHFLCNSWVYPFECYKRDRVFFSNQTYLPSETPEMLRLYRVEELENLRGNGTGKLEEWDRVYDYDIYNDLGDPDSGPHSVRQILGGSFEFPYPRRVRTARAPTKTDPLTESTLSIPEKLNVYVPRDEKFNQVKMSDFTAYALKAIFHFIVPESVDLFDKTPNEFETFDDVLKLYDDGVKVNGSFREKIKDYMPMELLKELLRSDGSTAYKFPVPQIIKENREAWKSDEEFAREMLAGLNPVVIRRLEKFPPSSKLDRELYGNQNSTITKEHIQHNLNGMSIDEAIANNKLFILDHHDYLMPYLDRINTTETKTYATRTLVFLNDDGTLKLLAIELSLPHQDGNQFGAVSKVYTPAKDGVEGTIWQLAKAYVAVNESGHHQLISHWLNTHCSIEPFIIATNRQLSILHPVHKLLHPHFRDTMNVNALARQTLINANGILERTVYPGKFALEMSSVVYKDWVFYEQALPADLIKRGVAVKDSNSPNGLKLLIEDYPFAVDGLQIWSAINTWVKDYIEFYYKTDEVVKQDIELQSWWKEVREKGHSDLRNASWWDQMETREELINSCTIVIWVASALHAAINFGQYPYGGYLPNRPSMSRRFMPDDPTSPEYDNLKNDPDKAFLDTITPQMQTILGISLIEQLSIHSSDEVYLGDREGGWTSDVEPLKALERFNHKLKEIEEKISEMNIDTNKKNRTGPANMPYTLLYRSSEKGLTGKGIPNSVSI